VSFVWDHTLESIACQPSIIPLGIEMMAPITPKIIPHFSNQVVMVAILKNEMSLEWFDHKTAFATGSAALW
jgi:hypothetical protein